MKRKTAKEILADSFREVAEKKNVDKITVNDITANCGYSPATFYRHYRDKYDLIAWDYSRRVEAIMDQMDNSTYLWKDILLDGAKFYERDKEYLKNLFLHTTGFDSFLWNMTKVNEDHLKAHITKTMGFSFPDSKTEIYLHAYCVSTVVLSCEWVLGHYQVSVEELAEVFEHTLPPPLKPYLCPDR